MTIHVVWEGLLAVPAPCFTGAKFRRRVRWRRYDEALRLWETNSQAVDRLWELCAEDKTVSIVSYLPSPLWPHLHQRLNDEIIPFAEFLGTTPADMQEQCVLGRVRVDAVVDPDWRRRTLYAGKGVVLDARHATLIGTSR